MVIQRDGSMQPSCWAQLGARWPALRSLEREREDIEVTKMFLLPSLIHIGIGFFSQRGICAYVFD